MDLNSQQLLIIQTVLDERYLHMGDLIEMDIIAPEPEFLLADTLYLIEKGLLAQENSRDGAIGATRRGKIEIERNGELI